MQQESTKTGARFVATWRHSFRPTNKVFRASWAFSVLCRFPGAASHGFQGAVPAPVDESALDLGGDAQTGVLEPRTAPFAGDRAGTLQPGLTPAHFVRRFPV